jgi:hypothetical protein
MHSPLASIEARDQQKSSLPTAFNEKSMLREILDF